MCKIFFFVLFLLCKAFYINSTLYCNNNYTSLNVAVSSNFNTVYIELKDLFEFKTSVYTKQVTGSTGFLYAQIINGATFDVFLSADFGRPYKLLEAGYTENRFLYTYANGKIVLWSKYGVLHKYRNMIVVFDDFTKHYHIAIPNKDLSPYGFIANKILTRSLCKNLTLDNLVIGENISQTYGFVDVGHVFLGFAALSQLTCLNNITLHSCLFNNKGTIFDILPHVLVLLPTDNIISSRCFFDFTQTYITIKIIQSFGYTVGGDVL